MNVPNLLTLARIAMVPAFGWLWAMGRHGAALAVFAAAGITDALDGLAARALNQQSPLGAVLDPAADKLMLLVSFLVAAATGAVPVWLAVLVIGRDVLLSAGAGVVALLFRERGFQLRIHPTRLGKYCTFAQLATILSALLSRAADAAWATPWIAALVWITGLLTVASAGQYLVGALLSLALSPAGVHPGALPPPERSTT